MQTPKRFAKEGIIIKKFIDEQGITQAQFAAALGYDDSTISKWICGERRPNADRIKKVYGFDIKGENKLKIKALREITSMEELDDAIEMIISEVKLDPAFEVTIRDMLEPFLYLMAGWYLFCQKHSRYDPLSWDMLGGDIECLLNRFDNWPIRNREYITDVLEGDKDLIVAKIERVFLTLEESLYEPSEGFCHEAASMGHNIGFNLLSVLPTREGTILTVFKTAVLRMTDIMYDIGDAGCEEDYPDVIKITSELFNSFYDYLQEEEDGTNKKLEIKDDAPEEAKEAFIKYMEMTKEARSQMDIKNW